MAAYSENGSTPDSSFKAPRKPRSRYTIPAPIAIGLLIAAGGAGSYDFYTYTNPAQLRAETKMDTQFPLKDPGIISVDHGIIEVDESNIATYEKEHRNLERIPRLQQEISAAQAEINVQNNNKSERNKIVWSGTPPLPIRRGMDMVAGVVGYLGGAIIGLQEYAYGKPKKHSPQMAHGKAYRIRPQ